MAPPGTKAIIYDDADSRASWAPRSLDAWLLGPSKDHYRCHLYYVPETTGYCVSGSADLFPQHCIAPLFSNEIHVNELSKEIQDTLTKLTRQKRTLQTIRTLAIHLDAFVSGTPLSRTPARDQPPEEQRVVPLQQTEEQRVITFQEPPLQ
jgi:hypothetical protein